MTEYSKKRSNVGTKTIQISVVKYNLNPYWLYTGEGSMLKSGEKISEKPTPIKY
jgi:hypothetical protein